MKFAATLLMVLSIAGGTFAQQPRQDSTKNYLLRRSTNQRTAAWVLLGGGTALVITGAILFGQSDFLSGKDSQSDIGGVLMLTGILADLGSIPLFIGASKNARKAASISLNNKRILFPVRNGLALQDLPSLTLKIPLGR